jgi:hypothetical protein
MKSNNTLLYSGLALLTIVGIASIAKNKTPQTPVFPVNPTNPTNAIEQPKPIVLNKKLLLKKGVTGPEVQQLQTWLNVGADGIFGNITESALFALKNVKETNLEKFPTLPNKNQNIIPKGSKVMANKPKVDLYLAKIAADGIFYKEKEPYTHIEFGKLIGVVLGATALGDYYVVKYDGWNGSIDFFVKASDVKKI